MFMWDELPPTTLTASPINQLKVSRGVRATTLCKTKILPKSSRETSPNTGICAMRGKRSDGGVMLMDSHEALARP